MGISPPTSTLLLNIAWTRWVNKHTNTYWKLYPKLHEINERSLVISPLPVFITFANYSAGALCTTIYRECGLTREPSTKNSDPKKSFSNERESQQKNLARLLNYSEITQPLNMIWLHFPFASELEKRWTRVNGSKQTTVIECLMICDGLEDVFGCCWCYFYWIISWFVKLHNRTFCYFEHFDHCFSNGVPWNSKV